MNTIFVKNFFLVKKVFLVVALFLFTLSAHSGQQSKKTSDSIPTLLEGDRLKLFQRDSTLLFYSERKNKPAWQNMLLRKTFNEFLKDAELQGL